MLEMIKYENCGRVEQKHLATNLVKNNSPILVARHTDAGGEWVQGDGSFQFRTQGKSAMRDGREARFWVKCSPARLDLTLASRPQSDRRLLVTLRRCSSCPAFRPIRTSCAQIDGTHLLEWNSGSKKLLTSAKPSPRPKGSPHSAASSWNAVSQDSGGGGGIVGTG
jgi:hypothetical protein